MNQPFRVSRIRSKRPKVLLLLEYGAYRCFEWLFQLISPTMVDRLGQQLGAIAYHLFPTRRRIVRRNCRIACQTQENPREWEILTKATFRRNGANLLGGMRCMMMDDETIQKHFRVEGEDLVRKILAQQDGGVIFALCHMGNWEILARIAHLIAPGVPAGAFYRPLNNPWMNRMTKRRRQRSGTKLFSNKEGFNQSVPLLRSGGMLGILSDQHAGRSGCLSTFFGRTTACSPLVELLHRRTSAKVFYVSITRDAPAHWHISITPHETSLPVNTRTIMSGIERALSRSLCDGFWLHNRWKQPSKTPLHHPHARECLDPKEITKPWRWVFITSHEPAIAQAASCAMAIAASSAKHTEVDIICDAVLEPIASHVRQHKRSKELMPQITAIDASRSYPIDAIILFGYGDEWAGLDFSESAPLVFAVKGKRKPKGCVTVPAKTSLTDSGTWIDYIGKLGGGRKSGAEEHHDTTHANASQSNQA